MDNYNGNNNGFNDVSENRAQNEPVQPQTGDRQIVYYTRPHQYIPEPPKNQKPKRNGYKIAFFSTIGVLAAACLIYVFVAGFNLINSYNQPPLSGDVHRTEPTATTAPTPTEVQKDNNETKTDDKTENSGSGLSSIFETESADGKKVLSPEQINEKCSDAVVGISCEIQSGYQIGTSVGSGIVMSEDGYILTNAHVVDGATKITVVFMQGDEFEAKVIGSDEEADIAIIKIEPEDYELTVAEFGDSSECSVGEMVVAIGTPYSLDFIGTQTVGYISAVNRVMVIDSTTGRTMTLIQTDATINPGNSGGPLINEYGQVIGINSIKYGMGSFEGLGFAIPINEVQSIIDDLLEYGYVRGRPYVGINYDVISEYEQKRYGIPAGIYVGVVGEGTPAADAGLQVGDIITKFGEDSVTSSAELTIAKNKYTAGDVVEFEVYRPSQAKYITVKVTLGESVPSAS
ncbi:MAG: trypsin-like serine protease [Ruminococcaceae bacterium]|nr:trypsin-like serine protease [Oscillospiraceae bacterium]